MSVYRKVEARALARIQREFVNTYRDGELDLEAPYQRGAVWTLEQKQNLWKSMIMGLPVGSVFLNLREGHGRYVVVDGQQRLRAIIEYMSDEFALPSEWMEPDFLGDDAGDMVRWSDLSDTGRSCLGHGLSPISCYESRLKTVEEEAELYLLINFGGVEQTGEDRARAERVQAEEAVWRWVSREGEETPESAADYLDTVSDFDVAEGMEADYQTGLDFDLLMEAVADLRSHLQEV